MKLESGHHFALAIWDFCATNSGSGRKLDYIDFYVGQRNRLENVALVLALLFRWIYIIVISFACPIRTYTKRLQVRIGKKYNKRSSNLQVVVTSVL
jgi:hypothetical protein